jgi:hypothetical protein
MHWSRQSLLPWAALPVLVVFAGCGGGGDVKKVSGTLKYKGTAVPNVVINFTPDNGRMSWAETDNEGHFTLHYDKKVDGAVVGKHKVSVQSKPGAAEVQPGVPAKQPAYLAAMFEKYDPAKTTKVVTIEKSEDNLEIDLD